MFGHRFFGDSFFGPRYFGGNGTIVVVQPEPEQPIVVSSGGRPERPLPRRPRLPELVCEIVSGQGSQSVTGLLSFNLAGVVRTENHEQLAIADLGILIEGAATTRQAQHVKGHAWPSMRAAMRSSQAKTDADGLLDVDIVSIIKSGVVPQPVPTYAGKPLPKIFLTEPERKRRGPQADHSAN